MKTYKDKDGREWSIVVNVAQIKAVRDLVNVDLYGLFQQEANRLFTDPILLVDTIYALCREQCDGRKMSDADFGKTFDGATLEAAADALLEETINFFPPSRQKILRATVAKSKELAAPIESEILGRIDALSLTDLLKPIAPPAS